MVIFTYPKDIYYILWFFIATEICYLLKEFKIKKGIKSLILRLLLLRIDGIFLIGYLVLLLVSAGIYNLIILSVLHIVY